MSAPCTVAGGVKIIKVQIEPSKALSSSPSWTGSRALILKPTSTVHEVEHDLKAKLLKSLTDEERDIGLQESNHLCLFFERENSKVDRALDLDEMLWDLWDDDPTHGKLVLRSVPLSMIARSSATTPTIHLNNANSLTSSNYLNSLNNSNYLNSLANNSDSSNDSNKLNIQGNEVSQRRASNPNLSPRPSSIDVVERTKPTISIYVHTLPTSFFSS